MIQTSLPRPRTWSYVWNSIEFRYRFPATEGPWIEDKDVIPSLLCDSLCLVGDGVHDLADVLQVGDEGLLVDGVLLQPREDVLQPGRKN